MATSAEVAEATASHPVVVRRLLGRLRSDGLVESRSGPHGGWAIAKDPALTRIGDVHRALADAQHPAGSALQELLAAAEDAFVEQLDRVTLADLASPPDRHRLRPHS
jgi:DNA-binding IscR family transcriptional regulator